MIGPWELFATATALAAAGGLALARPKPSGSSAPLEEETVEPSEPARLPRRRRGPRRNAAKLARGEREVAAAKARDARIRELIDSLPPPPPDPARVTAPAEIAELRAAWERWHASLTEEQRDALRVAHNRAIVQNGTPR